MCQISYPIFIEFLQATNKLSVMSISIANLSPLAALIAGILIIIFPKFLNYYIAAYLIIVGLLGLGLVR